MNLLRLINEEPIGGLEISDSHIRLTLLKRGKSSLEIKTLLEETLSSDVINDGLIKKESEFIVKIKKLSGRRLKYLVVSLPADKIFSKIYPFPAVMPNEKISESMKLIADFQLPHKRSEVYCDWEKAEADSANKNFLLASAPISLIENFLNALKKAGLKVVAVESHSLSLARALKQKPDETSLILKRDRLVTTFSVIKNNLLIFSQSLPNEKIKSSLRQEVDKIIKHQTWFDRKISGLILIGSFDPKEIKDLPLKPLNPESREELGKKIKIKPETLTSLGAAWRGLIPRKEDELISLMKVGTEEAFRQAKANATAGFLTGASFALSLFFSAALAATWFILVMMQNNFNEEIAFMSALPGADNAVLIENKAEIFNRLIGQTETLARQETAWSPIVEEIKNRIVSGITINTLSLPGAEATFSLSGIAVDRDRINSLRDSFASSDLFTEVTLPLDNLGKKADIPFSLTFKITDPEILEKNIE